MPSSHTLSSLDCLELSEPSQHQSPSIMRSPDSFIIDFRSSPLVQPISLRLVSDFGFTGQEFAFVLP